jgi:uncharacterized protein (TIGR04255 family)
MSISPIVTINPEETFECLPKAPIVEAVIDLRARAETDWKEEFITDVLKTKLPDYPKKHSLSGFQQEFTLTPGAAPNTKTIETGWEGLRLQTGDNLNIAQFKRGGFSLSRLQPYERWEQLVEEAIRLWNIFAEIARPTEIQRLGLRYINRIEVPSSGFLLEDYMDPAPQGAKGILLPFQHFFHQDVLGVPGHPYAIQLIRTTQVDPGPNPAFLGLILDIDVFSLVRRVLA